MARGKASAEEQAIITMTRPEVTRAQDNLVARGYPLGIVKHAIERARGMAEWKTAGLSPNIRVQAFIETFRAELANQETWLNGVKKAIEDR